MKNSLNAVCTFFWTAAAIVVGFSKKRMKSNFLTSFFRAEAYHPFSAFFDVILSDKWQ